MDVGEMDGFAETVGIVKRDLLAVLVQPIPFAVVMKHSTQNPAVAVKIGELRGLQMLVKCGATDFLQTFFVVPQAANGGALRGVFQRANALLIRGISRL